MDNTNLNTADHFYIAGVQHRPGYQEFPKIADQLKPGTKLQLIGEPSNKFDRYAVKVYVAESQLFLGYVPKPLNIDICALHTSGYKFKVLLDRVDFTGEPWKWFICTVNPYKPTPTSP